MKYRAFWKSTWYESEDYGALCRCLAWLGAKAFFRPGFTVDTYFRGNLLDTDYVLVKMVADED